MFLRKSTINDIKELTAISIKAFDSDIQVGGKEAGEKRTKQEGTGSGKRQTV